jgi:superfamily II DNA/RNA helicase
MLTYIVLRMLVLDEADRLIDLGFEEDIRNVMDHFKVIQTIKLT